MGIYSEAGCHIKTKELIIAWGTEYGIFYLSVTLILHFFIDFIDFLYKYVKLGDDKLLPEGLDEQDNVSTYTSKRKTAESRTAQEP